MCIRHDGLALSFARPRTTRNQPFIAKRITFSDDTSNVTQASVPPILHGALPTKRPPVIRFYLCVLVNLPLITLVVRLVIERDPFAAVVFGIPLMLAQFILGIGITGALMDACWPHTPMNMRRILIGLPALSIFIQCVGTVIAFVWPAPISGSLI